MRIKRKLAIVWTSISTLLNLDLTAEMLALGNTKSGDKPFQFLRQTELTYDADCRSASCSDTYAARFE